MSFDKKPIIAPSILGANFSNLEKEISYCNNSEAQWIHLDIMDQQFVPNLSFGPVVVESLRKHSDLFFDLKTFLKLFKVHLPQDKCSSDPTIDLT